MYTVHTHTHTLRMNFNFDNFFFWLPVFTKGIMKSVIYGPFDNQNENEKKKKIIENHVIKISISRVRSHV